MNEVLVGATDNVVIRHSNGVDTATRCLQDMDAVKGPNVPDLGESMSINLRPGTYLGPLGFRRRQRQSMLEGREMAEEALGHPWKCSRR